MTTIVTTSPGFGKHGRVPERLAERGWQLIRCADPKLPPDELAGQVTRADFLVVGLVPVTSETVRNAPRLKGVLKHGVGLDNIDIAACTARGLPVTNTPGANADAVAELALGLMFALARNIPAGHASVRSGGWDRQVGTQLGGKILGIVGLGNIGRRLARLARALGMHVLAADPYPDTAFATAHGIEIVGLDDLLGRSDYVSLHVVGGTHNAGLIDAERIGKMKSGACLLNLARGEVVDLDAVADALEHNRLSGVAIDAFVTEPPDTRHRIFSHPRAVFTPHSGADTREAVENMGLMVIEDIACLLRDKLPRRCVNRADLEGEVDRGKSVTHR
ncbi:phosphoglycerate dehydrogenase [Chelativorans sp. M5D2P16]|uniref:phosphoglycerate dehydrogenase n=1 Tax=Chelativorans sp. M5D2P16 TaxID=3095678 RepID=UPI002ACA5586|nr:phosphoglycerate dehydrogenase [Chelativorans sp. M5D2P16]MDZ5699579.1 phosphoglycerate dehydrogenase [Chelativorans sp. M5D2P16]